MKQLLINIPKLISIKSDYLNKSKIHTVENVNMY